MKWDRSRLKKMSAVLQDSVSLNRRFMVMHADTSWKPTVREIWKKTVSAFSLYRIINRCLQRVCFGAFIFRNSIRRQNWCVLSKAPFLMWQWIFEAEVRPMESGMALN